MIKGVQFLIQQGDDGVEMPKELLDQGNRFDDAEVAKRNYGVSVGIRRWHTHRSPEYLLTRVVHQS